MVKVMLHKIIMIIIINLFYCNQMHPNFRLNEKILKNIIHRYISPTDNNEIIFIIYYKKFKTLNTVVNNNSFPPTKILEKTNVIYQFKCPLGECISDNKKKKHVKLVIPLPNYQGGSL